MSILIWGFWIAVAIVIWKNRKGMAEFGRMNKSSSSIDEGIKRTGRVALWATLPPVGLWRSIHHGKVKSEDRLAKKIAEEMKK